MIEFDSRAPWDLIPGLWPISGGKGGVGKTALCASLAVALGERMFQGNRTDRKAESCDFPGDSRRDALAIDADLGGSNLHTALGLREGRPGLAAYFRDQAKGLADWIGPSGFEGLELVFGDNRDPEIERLADEGGRRFERDLQGLAPRPVLLDLGAGSGAWTSTLFTASPHPILVVQPTPLSVSNAAQLVRSAIYARLRDLFPEPSMREAFDSFGDRDVHGRLARLESLLERADKASPLEAARVRLTLSRFRPRLFLNGLRNREDLDSLLDLRLHLRERLGLEAEILGYWPENDAVRRSLEARVPLVRFDPDGPCARRLPPILQAMEKTMEENGAFRFDP